MSRCPSAKFSDKHVEQLASAIRSGFGNVALQHDFGWQGHPALTVLDCVLSLNRRYDSFVLPRLHKFRDKHSEVVSLKDLHSLITSYKEQGEGAFSRAELNYNHAARERTLLGVVEYLRSAHVSHAGSSEWERLQRWARSVKPEDADSVGVRGFGLAGFQYLRMLLGVQTVKPDVHLIRYVSRCLGGIRVSDIEALQLLEAAAANTGLPIRELGTAIWESFARSEKQ